MEARWAKLLDSRFEKLEQERNKEQTFALGTVAALSQEVMNAQVSHRFAFPVIQAYDGKGDPTDHIRRLETSLFGRNVSEQIKCLIFPGTVTGIASDWFHALPANSILNFQQFQEIFMRRFTGNTRTKRTASSIFVMEQKENQTLKSWFEEFFRGVAEVGTLTENEVMAAFERGLKPGEFARDLSMTPPISVQDLSLRATRQIQYEEKEARRNTEGRNRSKPENRRDEHKTARGKQSEDKLSPPLTPLNASRSLILNEIKGSGMIKLPTGRREGNMGKDSGQYCEYHRARGHGTESCRQLKSDIERLVQDGRLESYVKKKDEAKNGEAHGRARSRQRSRTPPKRNYGAQQGENRRDGGRREKRDNRERKDDNRYGRDVPPAGVIHVIAGGVAAGGTSSNAKK